MATKVVMPLFFVNSVYDIDTQTLTYYYDTQMYSRTGYMTNIEEMYQDNYFVTSDDRADGNDILFVCMVLQFEGT